MRSVRHMHYAAWLHQQRAGASWWSHPMPAIEARSEREVNDGLKLKIETAIEYRCILKTCSFKLKPIFGIV